MLILSQDKRQLINLENIDRIFVGTDNHIYYGNNMYVSIGKFDSELEAVKVISDICSAYEYELQTDNRWNGLAEVPMVDCRKTVYKIPQKGFTMEGK